MDFPRCEQSEPAEDATSNLQSAASGALNEFDSSMLRAGALTDLPVSFLYRRNNDFDFDPDFDSDSEIPPSESVDLYCPNNNNIILATHKKTIGPQKIIRRTSWYCEYDWNLSLLFNEESEIWTLC